MTSSPIPAARSQYLLDLLAQVPDPRKRRGRRHSLGGLLAAGIAAVIAGSKSFAAIGQWAAYAGPEVLAVLGAMRGPAEESTFRRAFAPGQPRCARPGPRRLAAHQGRAGRRPPGDRHRRQDRPRRQEQAREGPHLIAALAHGTGAVQVAVDAEPNEIPAARELLKAFASLAGAVITIGALHTQSDTAQVITGRQADYMMTVKGNMPTLYKRLKGRAALWRDRMAVTHVLFNNCYSDYAHRNAQQLETLVS
jgi:predicted transposase YbfD/YdcC